MKAYVFDLDGTLLDSTGVWAQIDVDFLARRGLTVPPDYIDAMAALSFAEAAAYTIARFGLPDDAASLMREWYAMAVHAYGHTVAMKPHARAYLLTLKRCGVKLGIATSLPSALYMPALRNHGIDTLFDAVCTTEEVPHGKAQPDIFLLIAQRLGVQTADCMLFEDVLQAIQSAKAAGMTVYGVRDAANAAQWPAIVRHADGVLDDFSGAPLPLQAGDMK